MKYFIILFIFFALGHVVHAQNADLVSTEIRLRVESGITTPLSNGERICCRASVSQFYFSKLFDTVWDDRMAEELIEVIKSCDAEGLEPADYHMEALEKLLVKQDKTNRESAEFELMLTDAFILLASHMMSGKVDPKTIDSNWKAVRREGDPLQALETALDSGSIKSTLLGLRPSYKAYSRLMEKLALYRQIESNGGWEQIPEGSTIKLNLEDERVLAIRKRLRSTGDLKSYTVEDLSLYDEEMERSMRAFQKRHGLEVDGNVGKTTLQALNVPVKERIKDIQINLERCRWLPQDLGDHYVMVNLPSFEMEVVKNNEVTLEMEVAVGKPYRQTPVFSAKMIYLVLNPYWTVPPTILANDILPAQAKNPKYIQNLNIKVVSNDGSIVDPGTIDWTTATPKTFGYQLRQDPGPNNALGEVKFIFPNPYNIYMHDTNHRELFVKTDRALSSGCIRLSRPHDLTSYLLVHHGDWSEEKISTVLKSQQNYSVPLRQPLNVYLQYWTSFIDERGVLNFRKDIYSRNEQVYKRLTEQQPSIL